MKCHVVIFYGEMGSGKSYSARNYADKFNLPFFEGDDVVTPEMQKCILFRPVPKVILEDFIFNHFVPAVIKRANVSTDLVVAQALYSREHRRTIKEMIQAAGHSVEFIWIQTPFIQNIRQLLSRPMGFRWVLYWLLSHFFFQS